MAFDNAAPDQGNPAPIGADPVKTDSSVVTEPTPIELKEDSFIKVPGQDKPVKFSEYGKSFQAQFTKASQRAAALERELQTERANRQKFEQERSRQAAQPQGAQPDVYGALRELPYLSGEQAVEVVQGITEQIKQRDQVLIAALQKMQQMEQRLGGLYDTHTNSSFDAKITKWVTDLGYGPGAAEIAKEIYLAYEGNDLDQEFPRIFDARMKQIEQLFETRKRESLANARRQPFVPGKGGQTSPSQPLQLKPNATSREVADALWGGWQGNET